MLKTVEGVYRNGVVELLEPLAETEGRIVIVTVPRKKVIDLKARGISKTEAAELRWKFGAIAEDWDRPEMDVYDEL